MVSAQKYIELDGRVEAALHGGDEAQLDILAFGEISVVLRLEAEACKRLPVFDSATRLARYRACFDDYVTALEGAGIRLVPSRLEVVERAKGEWVAYCVQPLLEARTLGPRWVRGAGHEDVRALFAAITQHVVDSVSPRLGLDAQLSNWAYDGERASYLDVTTPLLRDESGRNLLDAELFLAALPRLLRQPIERFVLQQITDKYHQSRGVIVDAIANLYKERLAQLIPLFIDVVNAHPGIEPAISEAEVQRYYRADARTWAALLWLRRFDRAWHRRVLRRPYPFLLPGRIER